MSFSPFNCSKSAESKDGRALFILLGTLIPAVLMHSVEARLYLKSTRET